jgi:hypothetical protein
VANTRTHVTRRRVSIVIVTSCLALIALGLPGQVLPDDVRSSESWRDGDCDSVNALYVLLKVHSLDTPYEALADASRISKGGNSLTNVLRIAQAVGHPLIARQISPRQLETTRLPVLSHLDGDTPDRGSFILVLGVQQDELLIMDGAHTQIRRVTKEAFLRRWTGVIALPSASHLDVKIVCAVAGCIIGMILGRVKHV